MDSYQMTPIKKSETCLQEILGTVQKIEKNRQNSQKKHQNSRRLKQSVASILMKI